MIDLFSDTGQMLVNHAREVAVFACRQASIRNKNDRIDISRLDSEAASNAVATGDAGDAAAPYLRFAMNVDGVDRARLVREFGDQVINQAVR